MKLNLTIKFSFEMDCFLYFSMISQYVNIIWTKPYCRAVPYLVGLWLGHRIFIEKEAMVKIRKVKTFITQS